MNFELLSSLQQIPDVIRGAVLGYGLCAPSNERAINISFGSQGFSFSLARAFKLVRDAKSLLGYSSYSCQHSHSACQSMVFDNSTIYIPLCVWTSVHLNSFLALSERHIVYGLCIFTIDTIAVYLSHIATPLPHTGWFHQFWSFLQRLWESNCASAVPSQRDCISLPWGHSEPRCCSSHTSEDWHTDHVCYLPIYCSTLLYWLVDCVHTLSVTHASCKYMSLIMHDSQLDFNVPS